jgi:NOL1/NOP2/fmu family ribosome biogenesis protein
MGPFCDLVLVDAPCSGEGMFRKDPFARAQWSEGLVMECAARQRIILDAAWAVLKPGGYLIYSTCTWEERENEEQVNGLLARGAELVQVPVENEWGMVSAEPGLRCYPHRVRGEGFFLAVLHKPGEGSAVARSPGKVATEVFPEVMDWLDPSVEWRLSERDGTLYGITGPWSTLLDDLASQVRMMAPGIPVAVRKGGAWVPHPALALNQCLRPGAFHAVDLDREQVMQFLRGEAIAAEAASGAALMRFQGLGLGWGQGAGRRWNNRWPAPWRIRMR